MSQARKQLYSVLPIVGIAIGILLLLAGNIANKTATEKNREIGKQNNTYLRIMTCIASVSPTKRTPAYTNSCYDMAEQQTGVQVTRFGDGR